MKLINIFVITISTYALGFAVGCKKSTEIQSMPSNPPVVTTKSVADISSTSVVAGGELANAINIIDKGIVWGTDSIILTVSIANKISKGAGPSSFTDTIQNLQSNTTYYLRAYALYSAGVVYGAIVKFITLSPQPMVYIVGYHDIPAAYWKDGKLFSLATGTYAHSVYVVGNDVYVAGEYNGGAGIRAMYWKNGIPVPLTNGPNTAVANSIYVFGNDVYVAGYEVSSNDNILPVAKYWKNGVAINLTNGTDRNMGIANCICVVGSDVYVAGFTANRSLGNQIATYWKNGIAIPLTDSNKVIATAQSIFVQGNDVYIAGNEKPGLGLGGVPVAKYWKNGIPVSLTNGAEHANAYSIYVTGSDVYIAGFEYDGSTGYSVAKYWKNGTAFSLTDGTLYGTAQSIYVVGNDVYVAGSEDNGFNSRKAKYWKNGVSLSLEISAKFSTAVSIFVQ